MNRLVLLSALLAVLAAACDRLPARGGLAEPCFGNDTCSGDLDCDPVDKRCKDSACVPQCEGKCEGASDTCGGTCHNVCLKGFLCSSGECLKCDRADRCGDECEDCASGESDWKCVNDGTATLKCGCITGQDCLSGTCNGVTGTCDKCIPDCTGKICPDDDGCGGLCHDCPAGQFCDVIGCAECQEDEHCGPDCDNCLGQISGRRCVQIAPPAGGWSCGCTVDGDCDDGFSETCQDGECLVPPCSDPLSCGEYDCTAPDSDGPNCYDEGTSGCTCGCEYSIDCDYGFCNGEGVCERALLWSHKGGTRISALAITPDSGSVSPPVLAVGRNWSNSDSEVLSLWTLDEDLSSAPDHVLDQGSTHQAEVYQLAFTPGGDLFSSVLSTGKWFRWPYAEGLWNSQAQDLQTSTGGHWGIMLATGGGGPDVKVATTEGSPAFQAVLYGPSLNYSGDSVYDRQGSIKKLGVDPSGSVLVMGGFLEGTDTGGATAVDIANGTENQFVSLSHVYDLAMSTDSQAGFEVAVIAELTASSGRVLKFYDSLLSEPGMVGHLYGLSESSENLVSAANDSMVFVGYDPGRVIACSTGTDSALLGPTELHQMCEYVPLLAASGNFLVTACGNELRLWSISTLLAMME